MALEDGAIALVAAWLSATTAFDGTIVQASTGLIDIADDFAIVDIAEEGVTFTANGNGSFEGTISVTVALIFSATSVAGARQYSSDVRYQLLQESDSRLLSLSTSQIAMLEPEDSPYDGRWSCEFTLELYCKP